MSPFSGSANIHPNVLLSLSLDRTASRAAYLAGHESYDRRRDYLGYFNPKKCYAYQGGNRNIVNGYFKVLRDADGLHECSQSFSGNFMNWASASLLDMLRYALTGGDRVVDTVQSTVLQRAFLSENAYADPLYFPRKVLKPGGDASPVQRVTPFNVGELRIVSCGNRILFSDVQGNSGSCDTPAYDGNGKLAQTDKRLGEYLVRVQVCDRQDAATRTDLCLTYGKAFKPVGVLQRHADAMRVAVMGYVLDASERRYGGVLRSPMKYLGDHAFAAPGFLRVANPAREWDPTTGILYANPAPEPGGDAGISGAINAINRFGRSGRYPQSDPIGELYYEGLRYLQAKPPTPAAFENLQPAMKDGLPALEAAADPVPAACQKNYMVSIGDANAQWDRYLPGNRRTRPQVGQTAYDAARAPEAATGTTPALDAAIWTAKVGELEADPSGRYANPATRPHLAALHLLDTGERGQGSYYMAGLAYWAATQNIRLDKPIRVRTLAVDLDANGNGTLDGGGRAVKPEDSQLFLAAKYGGFRDANRDGNPHVTLDADGKTTARFSTDEWQGEHAGIPNTYRLAGDPVRLLDGIRAMFAMLANEGSDAFADVATHHVLDASAATAGMSALGGQDTLYQAGFDRAHWSGYLKRFAVEQDRDGMPAQSALPEWEAGTLLTGTKHTPPFPPPEQRKIYTSVMQPGRPFRTVAFRWPALEADQRSVLDNMPGQSGSDGLGEKRVEYLRGVRSFELGRQDGIFRARRSILGDIVNSKPVVVGAPAAAAPDPEYAAFYARHHGRPKAVYAGANDGMLHAFDAGNGSELFAYIPSALLPALASLTHPDYLHRPYVDGGIAAADIKVAGRWETVLAATMGAGARGVFALDISDPVYFGEKSGGGSGAIWEFTERDDPDMGHVVAAPQIAKFRTKLSGDSADEEYFVVVPSGTDSPDGSARPSLFLLSLQKDPDMPWKLGVNYYKIRLPAGEANLPNALAMPVLAGDAGGAVRQAYAGDLQGNVWRFDFKDGAPWSKALGTTPRPLFTARDDAGFRQPITMQPKLAYAAGGYMVLVGTGRWLDAQDAAPGGFHTQSIYAVVDSPDARTQVGGRGALLQRVLSVDSGSGEILAARAAQDGAPSMQTAAGWFADFPHSERTGERLVSGAVLASGRLFFSTLLPSASPCEHDGSRFYAMDVLSGLPAEGRAIGYTLAMGVNGVPLVMTQTLETTGARNGARRRAKKRYTVLDPNEQGYAGPSQRHSLERGEIRVPAGRLSWREITNWQELRDEALGK